MSLHRFFVAGRLPEAPVPTWRAALSEGDLRHLTRALRMLPGDRLVLVDPIGIEAECVLRECDTDDISVEILSVRRLPQRPRIALAQGLTRRERMELVIQKTTELGVSEIMPVAFARSIVRLDEERADRRSERWRRIAEGAAKQSQRADLPIVRDVTDLAGLVETCARFDVTLVAWEEAATTEQRPLGIGEALDRAGVTSASSVLVIVGPEGGLEAAEVATLTDACGAITVGLGETVLRTETAGVVAVALASYELGALGGRPRG